MGVPLPEPCLQDQHTHLSTRQMCRLPMAHAESLSGNCSHCALMHNENLTREWLMGLQRPDLLALSWDPSTEWCMAPYGTDWRLFCLHHSSTSVQSCFPGLLYMLFLRAVPSKPPSHKSPSRSLFPENLTKGNCSDRVPWEYTIRKFNLDSGCGA